MNKNEHHQYTVKQVAAEARAYAFRHYGGPDFARMCMDFDYRICEAADEKAQSEAEEERGRLEEVLRVMATGQMPDLQLGVCWLDAKGYGEMSIAYLEEVLERIPRSE